MTITQMLRAAAMSTVLLAVPAFAPAASAADDKSDAPAAEAPAQSRGRLDPAALVERFETALKELALTDEQKAKAKEIVGKARRAVAEGKGEGRERLQAAARALADLRQDVNGLLTEPQRKALAEKLPLLARRAAGDAPAAMQQAIRAALEKLDLSADQKAKIKALNDEAQAKLKAVTEEARGQDESLAEKVRPILQEQREKLAQMLSGDQAPKFQAAVREHLEKLRGGRPATAGDDAEAGKKGGGTN